MSISDQISYINFVFYYYNIIIIICPLLRLGDNVEPDHCHWKYSGFNLLNFTKILFVSGSLLNWNSF